MTGLPPWLSGYAALDDPSLAVLANPGLVRRGAVEVGAGRVRLISVGEDAVRIGVGTPQATVTLLASGPVSARCSCPVAGVCVHVVAACVWARTAVESEPDSAVDPHGAEGDSSGGSSGEAAAASPAATVLDEVLGWDPETVNRQVGIAAVRRVRDALRAIPAAALGAETVIEVGPRRLAVSWPDSPQVMLLAGIGIAGTLVDGTHSKVAEATWKLQAVVRVFARYDRPWDWPPGADQPAQLAPGQAQTAAGAVRDIEEALRVGLSHLGPHVGDALMRLAQRATLEGLPLLSSLLGRSAAAVGQLGSREDQVAEEEALSLLARAWALATAVQGHRGALPAELVGRGEATGVDLVRVLPLAARWWQGPDGARGLTVRFWDVVDRRVETVITGRRAGVDPTFRRSSGAQVIWNASVDQLTGGPLRLEGAERRADGILSPTSRTRVVPDGTWADVDLAAVAEGVHESRRSADAVGFGPPRGSVRLVRPRRVGIGPLEIDEVAQQVVWTLTDRAGLRHRVGVDAGSVELDGLAWVLAARQRIEAVTIADGRPESVFVRDESGLRLLAPSLVTVRDFGVAPRLRRRLEKLREQRIAPPDPTPRSPLDSLCADVREVLTALAATGAAQPSVRHAQTLADRSRRARDLGLLVLADSLDRVIDDSVGRVKPADVLRAVVVVDRVEALADQHS